MSTNKYFRLKVHFKYLKSIAIVVNGIQEIGDGCFQNSNFEEIHIASSVEMIDKNAFQNCERLKVVRFAECS